MISGMAKVCYRRWRTSFRLENKRLPETLFGSAGVEEPIADGVLSFSAVQARSAERSAAPVA